MRCWILLAAAACGHAGDVRRAASPGQPASYAEIAARAVPFVDAFSNSEALLAPDGQVVFLSTRDGLPQLYVGAVGEPGRPPRRLPVPRERVAAPRLLPDGTTLVFLSDVGSDQKFHLFRIGLDGSGLTDLTPSGELRRMAAHVARRAGTLVYDAHALDDPATRVFVQAIDGPPREVFRDPKVGFVADVSADGTRALYVQTRSDTDEVLFALDLASGAPTRLFPPEGQICALGTAALTADGASAITTCAARDRALRVIKLDAATGVEQAHHDETEATAAAIGDLAVSPTGGRVVVALEVGEHTELRMFDADQLGTLTAPVLAPGGVDLGAFDASGRRLTLTLREPGTPPEIAVFDVVDGGVKPLRTEPRQGLGRPPRATVEQLRAFDGRALPVNVYRPDRPGRLPTLVLIHGGPTSTAKLAWSPTIGFWTAMGFAVIAPNIRGSGGYGIEYEQADDREHRIDAVRDVESVNRWARAQPWCDGDKLVIGGISYGGYMTLLALTRQPTLWRAGIDGSGMSNLKTMEQLEDQTIRSFDDTEFGVLGKDDALLAEWSPITAVDQIVAPVFVYQGMRDPITPQHEADQIVAALQRRHVPVEYMLIANEGHGVTRRDNLIAYLARSYRFVAEHLGLR